MNTFLIITLQITSEVWSHFIWEQSKNESFISFQTWNCVRFLNLVLLLVPTTFCLINRYFILKYEVFRNVFFQFCRLFQNCADALNLSFRTAWKQSRPRARPWSRWRSWSPTTSEVFWRRLKLRPDREVRIRSCGTFLRSISTVTNWKGMTLHTNPAKVQ